MQLSKLYWNIALFPVSHSFALVLNLTPLVRCVAFGQKTYWSYILSERWLWYSIPDRSLQCTVLGTSRICGDNFRNVSSYIHTHRHIDIVTYIHTYIRTYIHTYIHTYIRTYIHTVIRTYVRTIYCVLIYRQWVCTYVRT